MQNSTVQIRVRKGEGGQPAPPVERPRSGAALAVLRDFERPLPRVPGYEILAELGRGGMGVVYKARQVELDRVVALKMVLASEFADAKQLQRFLIEAETLAAVHHPNIIQIHAIGAHEGRPFLALEFVAGGSLESKLDGAPRCPFDSAECIATLAGAVHHAHRQGVVHRDLKPSNILLRPDPLNPESLGKPKLGDFGLAKRLHEDNDLTQTGTVLGTPAYMAPEQACGDAKEVAATADVYSLGAILYELLAGQPPFKSAGALDAMLQMKQRDPTPPGRIRRKLPRDLEVICLKALDKDPARRYQTAADLADDLRRFLREEPIHARSIGPLIRAVRWSKRNVAYSSLIGALAATVVAGFAAVSWQWHRAAELHQQAVAGRAAAERAEYDAHFYAADALVERGSHLCDSGDVAQGLIWLSRASTFVPDEMPLRESLDRILSGWARRLPAPSSVFRHEGAIAHAVYRPDGSAVAAAFHNGDVVVWPVDRGPGAPFQPPVVAAPLVRLRLESDALCIAYSRDGRRIATGSADGAASIWDADTGAPVRTFAHAEAVRCVAFSPDGRWLATCSNDFTARVWDLKTGAPVTPVLRHSRPVREVAFRPDGKMLATASDDYDAGLWRLPSGDRVPAVMHHVGSVRRAVFSPDGRWLATAGNEDWARIWDGETGAAVGEPLKFRNSVAAVAFHPDGRRLFVGSEDRTGQVVDLTSRGRVLYELRCSEGFEFAEFSSDGRFLLTGSDGCSAHVWRADDGALISGDLLNQQSVSAVGFAPDGRSVMTAADDGILRVWRIPALEPNLHAIPAPSSAVAGLGVGEQGMLFSCMDGIWMKPTGGEFRKVFPIDPKRRPTCSVVAGDGSWAACSLENRSIQVWSPFEETPRQRRLDGTLFAKVEAIDATRDGRLLLAGGTSREDSGVGAAGIWDVAEGRLIAELPGHHRAVESVALSADGRLAATSSGDGKLRLWKIGARAERCAEISHPDMPTCISFSPDGRLVATGCGDKAVRLWDVSAGRLAAPPILQRAAIVVVAFSRDGKLVAAGAIDGSVQIFDVATARSVGPVEKLAGPIHALAFSADGTSVIAGGSGFPLVAWPIPSNTDTPCQELCRWIEIAAGMEAEPVQGVVPLSSREWRRRLEAAGASGGG